MEKIKITNPNGVIHFIKSSAKVLENQLRINNLKRPEHRNRIETVEDAEVGEDGTIINEGTTVTVHAEGAAGTRVNNTADHAAKDAQIADLQAQLAALQATQPNDDPAAVAKTAAAKPTAPAKTATQTSK